MTTAERIKARRTEIGMSADSLADAVGVSRSTIFRYENGHIEKLPIDKLIPIAINLRTTVEYLLFGDEPNEEDMKKLSTVADGELMNKFADAFSKLSPERQLEAIRYLQYLLQSEEQHKP